MTVYFWNICKARRDLRGHLLLPSCFTDEGICRCQELKSTPETLLEEIETRKKELVAFEYLEKEAEMERRKERREMEKRVGKKKLKR